MIELRTGLPGNGKTLSMIQELAAMLAKWDKPISDESKSQARPVFVHNVKDLILPHSVFPVIETKNEKTGGVRRVPDWSQVPDGSLCIIDEAQDLFPPRSSQSEAPPHVAWLNTHRHRGVDLVIITQHPKLIDGAVRALVGKHKHYRRVFGMNRSIVYEWDGCSDSLSGMKNATTSHWSFPADAYKWYKSAEVHTKQSFKLPMWLGIPVLAVALGAYFVPKAYAVLSGGVKGNIHADAGVKPVPTQAAPAASGPVAQGGAIAPTVAKGTANGSVQIAQVVRERTYAGCIASASKCWCLDESGSVEVEPEQCQESARSHRGRVRFKLNGPAATYVPAAAVVVPDTKKAS